MPFLQKRIGSTSGSFGEALQEMRELRGYTREQLGKLSGIHPHILRLLEEDRIDELADPAYDERHVYALARALETAPTYLAEKYRALLDQKGVARSHALFPGARVGVFDLFVRARAVAFAGFFTLALIIAGYVFFAAKNLTTVPHLLVSAPEEGAVVQEPTIHIIGTTDPGAFVFVNGSSAVVDGSGTFSTTLDVPRGVSVVHIETKRRYGPSAVIDRHVTYATIASNPLDNTAMLETSASSTTAATSSAMTAVAATSTPIIKPKPPVKIKKPSAATSTTVLTTTSTK